MAEEREMKLKVEDFTALKARLRSLEAKFLGTVLQTETYFDTADQRLFKEDSGLRLRQVKKLHGRTSEEELRPQLTFKGPRRPHGRVKIRPEIQIRLDDARAITGLLKALGFEPSLVYQKRRSSYRLGRCRIELDEVPHLGRFVEVEGPDERSIHSVCGRLKLQGRPILAPYTHLLADYCRTKGLSTRHIPFRRG